MNRILRNAPHDASPVDEVVAHDVTMHLEQMGDEAYWIGVYRPGTEDSLDIDLVVVKGKLVVTVREERWTWERDETHPGARSDAS